MESGFDIIRRLAHGKPVAVFGAGVSGKAVERLANKAGLDCVLYAENGGAVFDSSAAQKHALAVYSPAFRPDNKWIAAAQNAGCKCVCEPDFAALLCEGKIIAITGTNGKTTITRFLEKALCDCGFDAVAAGNVGTPLSQIYADGGTRKTVVCELSSFQTMRLEYLRPDALIWTNFDADHLDWHKDLREYFLAKFNLVAALKSEVFIAGSSVESNAEKFGINLPPFARIFDESKSYPAPAPFSSAMQSRNFRAVEMLWEALGLDEKALENSAKTFALPKFRFSSPKNVGGVRFFNDSKATNVHAAVAALREMKGEKNLVWLGGGKDKNCDLRELADTVAQTCKAAVLIGQTAEKLAALLSERNIPCRMEADMQSAAARCFELAGESGAVLFSPAFSSFGMFAGYADRGKCFDEAVLCLKNSKEVK